MCPDCFCTGYSVSWSSFQINTIGFSLSALCVIPTSLPHSGARPQQKRDVSICVLCVPSTCMSHGLGQRSMYSGSTVTGSGGVLSPLPGVRKWETLHEMITPSKNPTQKVGFGAEKATRRVQIFRLETVEHERHEDIAQGQEERKLRRGG